MFRWIHRLADESHRSESVAARWHVGQALAYSGLILGYICMTVWHLAAAKRHRQAAAQKLPSARRADSEVWDETT